MAKLSREEQFNLVKAAQQNNLEALAKLTQDMLPYVKFIIKKVLDRYEEYGIDKKHLSYDDILQAGLLGLIGAVNVFDEKKGAAFSTYAYWKVEEAVQNQISFELDRLGIKKSDGVATIVSFDDEKDVNQIFDDSEKLFSINEIDFWEEEQDKEEKFQKAIANLTENEKNVLFMINGIDTEQTSNCKKIARVLGVSEMEVKKAIRSASKKISDAWGK